MCWWNCFWRPLACHPVAKFWFSSLPSYPCIVHIEGQWRTKGWKEGKPCLCELRHQIFPDAGFHCTQFLGLWIAALALRSLERGSDHITKMSGLSVCPRQTGTSLPITTEVSQSLSLGFCLFLSFSLCPSSLPTDVYILLVLFLWKTSPSIVLGNLFSDHLLDLWLQNCLRGRIDCFGNQGDQFFLR